MTKASALARVFGISAGSLILFSCVEPPDGMPTTSETTQGLTVGGATLKLCAKGVSYYCGTLTRPLDPAGQVSGTIGIHYEWYPHTNSGPAIGTIVAIEGGPGYGSTASRDYYTGSFDLTQRDMVLVDARGTGQSAAINCVAAQTDGILTQSDIAACGTYLGNTSDLYGSDLAADDMAAILDLLQVGKVDLYGDSYGTYSSQIFAGRHPDKVKTIVLDAAYPVLNADPFFAPEGAAIDNAFNFVCNRSPDCNGNSISRLTQLLNLIRSSPPTQAQVDRNGTVGPLAASDLAFLANVTAEQYNLYSEFDPAVRAYLAGDTVPLVRLVNETYPIESGGAGSVSTDYSIGMFLATTCQDGPTAYDMTLPPGAARNATYAAALAAQKAKNPNIYNPFAIDEFLAEPLDWAITPTCLQWPVASPLHPEGDPVPSGVMPDVPTMVLTGDLDTVTPVGEGDQVAAEFKHVQRVIGKNGVHVTAIGDPSGCFSGIVNAFVAAGGGTVDTSCASSALPIYRVVPVYPVNTSDMPLRATSGNTTNANLKAARVAVATANDAYYRYWLLGLTSGPGLRGGTFKVNKAGTVITLTKSQFASDLTVSGKLTMDATTGLNTAVLTLTGAASGSLTAVWDPAGPQGTATVTGTLGGAAVSITMPAP